MFRNTFQSGFLSVLYSIGSKPLQIWDKKVRNGHIKRITDQDIQSSVLEIMGTNVSTNYIETLRVQIHANCRIRRIYFSDRLYSEEELPPEFKLFLPVQKGQEAPKA